jgi:anti-anti-sigma factor
MSAHEAGRERAAITVQFEHQGVVTVKLVGEHDLSGKQHLRDSIAFASGTCDVLVELSECTFIDSSVVDVLLQARDGLTERGGRLDLIIPSEATAILRIAKLAALGSRIPIHESQDAALAVRRGERHSPASGSRSLLLGL